MKHSYRPQRTRSYPRHIHRNSPQKKGGKGRIRLFLLAIVLVVGGKLFWDKYENREMVEEVEEIVVSTSGDTTKVVEKKPVKKTVFKPKQLEFSDVKKMLTEEYPTLKASVDTVTWKRRKYIRYLSLDTSLQRSGEIYMKRYHPKYGAVVVLQPRTGRVLSLISYNNPEEPKVSDNLYANAEFPAASIFKTVTAAAVIEKQGMDKGTLLKTNGKNHTLYKAQLKKELEPFRQVTLGQAYAGSYNPVFGRLGIYYAGMTTLGGYAQKFGFNDPVPFELPVQISQYGTPEDTFSLAEVASGFNQKTTLSPILGALISGAVSNKGRMIRPTLVDSIVDLKTGTNVFTRNAKAWRIVMGENGADELRSLMNDVTQYGTARKSFKTIKNSSSLKAFEHGGKTGSVDRDGVGRVEWFVGFLKDTSKIDEDLACGVFTVHGQYWTVHSSYIGAEMMRKGIASIQKQKKEEEERLELIRIAKEKAVADSLNAYQDSVKAVEDSLKIVADSAKAVADSVAQAKVKSDSVSTGSLES